MFAGRKAAILLVLSCRGSYVCHVFQNVTDNLTFHFPRNAHKKKKKKKKKKNVCTLPRFLPQPKRFYCHSENDMALEVSFKKISAGSTISFFREFIFISVKQRLVRKFLTQKHFHSSNPSATSFSTVIYSPSRTPPYRRKIRTKEKQARTGFRGIFS